MSLRWADNLQSLLPPNLSADNFKPRQQAWPARVCSIVCSNFGQAVPKSRGALAEVENLCSRAPPGRARLRWELEGESGGGDFFVASPPFIPPSSSQRRRARPGGAREHKFSTSASAPRLFETACPKLEQTIEQTLAGQAWGGFSICRLTIL